MSTVVLRDEEWTKIKAFLEQERPKVFICHERRCRTFVEGVLWILRSGAPWRLLPAEYGNWNSVFKRFDIPPRKNRKAPRAYDRERYKERHLIECLIGKLKQFRHVFSRFDKLACNYLSFLHFAAALIWLR